MIERCYRPKHAAYSYYGGRGITICDEWLIRDGKATGFWNFVRDVGEKPDPELTLDRIDSDGPYAPGNVRWATKKEQSLNRVFGRTYAA